MKEGENSYDLINYTSRDLNGKTIKEVYNFLVEYS
jgi:hypothetical protein